MNSSIDHLIIAVSDLRKATADYGTANTLFKLDNTYIELLAADADGMAADIVNGVLDERGPCLGGLV
ncbi:MAG: VOC family protein, partial [Luminiphilus sp.]|nr:VOC family protein [Luminiphilus sp.]